jgi:hypothetical protein
MFKALKPYTLAGFEPTIFCSAVVTFALSKMMLSWTARLANGGYGNSLVL